MEHTPLPDEEKEGQTTPLERREHKAEVLKLSYVEQMAELLKDTEPGHYYGPNFPGYTPINTTR